MTAKRAYRVVLGVDYDDLTDVAFDQALWVVRERLHTELHAVQVLREIDRREDLETQALRLDEACERLQRYVHGRCSNGGGGGWQHVHYHVRVGDPATELLVLAGELDASLVVVGATPSQDRPRTGTVPAMMIHAARRPILLARPRDPTERDLASARGDEITQPLAYDRRHSQEFVPIGMVTGASRR